MSDIAPDLIEPIVAWRAWIVERGWKRVVLRSVTRFDEWPGDGWMVARCVDEIDDVPHEGCSCGIYAARNRKHLISQGYHTSGDAVIGEVALAGKVIPAARGYRAQKATPVRIFLPYMHWYLGAGIRATYPTVRIGLDSDQAA